MFMEVWVNIFTKKSFNFFDLYTRQSNRQSKFLISSEHIERPDTTHHSEDVPLV